MKPFDKKTTGSIGLWWDPNSQYFTNKVATLELNEKQIQGLLDVTEEMTSIICGAEESGMNIAEYAEYITGKADECRARLEGNP